MGWSEATDTDLKASSSGLYFEQAHPLITKANIASMLTDGSTAEDYMESVVDDGVAAMVNRILADTTLNGASKQLFEHKPLFDATGRINNRVASSHSIVGYEIVPLRGIGVTTQIHRIGVQMVGGTGELTLYLFHSSQSAPLDTFTIDVTSEKTYQWKDVENKFLRYMDDGHNAGGSFYICYNQDDMPTGMEAVNISKDWRREPCQACNVGNLADWRAMTKHIRVSPFRVRAWEGFSEQPELWDIADMVYTPTTCYGLNLEISIGCDLTDFIIREKSIFASVLQKEVAVAVLRRLAFNPEVTVNRNQLNASRQDILAELDGNTFTRSGGIGGMLKKAYDALEVDISGMDSACMACKRQGVRYGIA